MRVNGGPSPPVGDQAIRVIREIKDAADAGDDSRADELARAALAEGMRHPTLFGVRATWFWREGLYLDALIELEAALELAPENPLLLNGLGECLLKLGLWRRACGAFEAALARAPHLVQAHHKRGLALQMHGALHAAKSAHRRAVELQPDHAGALGSLALIAAGENNPESVRLFAERALAHDPSHPTASIAQAIAALNRGDADAVEGCVGDILKQARYGDDPPAIEALRELAERFDRLGKVPFAFAIYAAVNRKRREIHARRFAKNRSSGKVATLAAYFNCASRWSAAPPPAATPDQSAGHVFVLGFARSGTTLLETVLASNSRVVALDERDCFPDAATALLESPTGIQNLSTLRETALTSFRNAYWESVQGFGRSPARKVFVDKWPFNSRRLPLIARLFPDARVLFAVRDPRDVVLSCFRRSFALNPDTFEFLQLEDCARFYADTMSLVECSQQSLPLHLHCVRYEEVVADFDSTVEAVCRFIGIPWDQQMRDFGHAADATIDANAQSRTQVRMGLYAGAVGQWRRYKAELAPVLPILQPWIERFGYAAD